MTQHEYLVIYIWLAGDKTGTGRAFYKSNKLIDREEHVKTVEENIKEKCPVCDNLFISSLQLLRTYDDVIK